MKDYHASKKNKFMAVKPKVVSVARLAKTAYLQPHTVLPLVIEPEVDQVDLIEWAKTNRQTLDAESLKYGSSFFEAFACKACSNLNVLSAPFPAT